MSEATDLAAIALAVRLAEEIDVQADPKLVGDLSTKLLAVLTALGMTPAARNGIVKGGDVGGSKSGTDTLAELRDRSKQRAGLRAAPDIHPSA